MWAVRWYCRCGVSYRGLVQMMGERGMPVDHSTIYRYATIKGFEITHALHKGQAAIFNLRKDIRGEVRIVERAFGIGPRALTEAVALLATAPPG